MKIIATYSHQPWNKGKLVGQKAPLRVRDIWAIRVRLQLAEKTRDLALFNLAIDSKLRACDLTKLRVRDIAHGEHVSSRAIVMQQKTQHPDGLLVVTCLFKPLIKLAWRRMKRQPDGPQNVDRGHVQVLFGGVQGQFGCQALVGSTEVRRFVGHVRIDVGQQPLEFLHRLIRSLTHVRQQAAGFGRRHGQGADAAKSQAGGQGGQTETRRN
jgi:hypothetical protein